MDVCYKYCTRMSLFWDTIDSKTQTEEKAGHKPLHAPKQCFTKIKLIMTTEEKELLLKDLSARLPYGVMCKSDIVDNPVKLAAIYINGDVVFGALMTEIDRVKPYLFPLSSMTEEQKEEFNHLTQSIEYDEYGIGSIYNDYDDGINHGFKNVPMIDMIVIFDWLNAHHFDFRGLLEKGLAIDAIGLNIY